MLNFPELEIWKDDFVYKGWSIKATPFDGDVWWYICGNEEEKLFAYLHECLWFIDGIEVD